jgi:hypothetical protein
LNDVVWVLNRVAPGGRMMNNELSRVWKEAAAVQFNLLKPTGYVMHQQD